MLMGIMNKAWKVLFSLSFIFIITFVIFPGLIDAIQFEFWPSKWEKSYRKGWNDMANSLIFGIMDTIGRYMGGKIVWTEKVITILAAVRIIFILSTLAIVQSWFGAHSPLETDTFRMFNLVLFAFSNGFIGTQCTIVAPTLVAKDQQETVGLFSSLFLGLGINLGSTLAIPMANLVPQK
jgi:hypothetical protein